MQPAIGNMVGTVSNVSSPRASILERSDRIPPSVSMNSLVSLQFEALTCCYLQFQKYSHELPFQAAIDGKPRIQDDAEKIRSWKMADIADPTHLKALRLPDSTTAMSKVCDMTLFRNQVITSFISCTIMINCYSGQSMPLV